jgi:hypothetical protein
MPDLTMKPTLPHCAFKVDRSHRLTFAAKLLGFFADFGRYQTPAKKGRFAPLDSKLLSFRPCPQHKLGTRHLMREMRDSYPT